MVVRDRAASLTKRPDRRDRNFIQDMNEDATVDEQLEEIMPQYYDECFMNLDNHVDAMTEQFMLERMATHLTIE